MTKKTTNSFSQQLAQLYQAKGLPHLLHKGVFWHRYQGMAEPRHPINQPILLDRQEARLIRKELQAWLIRWTNPQSLAPKPTKGWYAIVCKENIDLNALNSKAQKKLVGQPTQYELRLVPTSEMQKLAYAVYAKAMQGYGISPTEQRSFESEIEIETDFPELVQYLGVFVHGQLVGYSKCYVLGREEVLIAVSKFDPDFLKYRIAGALTHFRNQFYLEQQGIKLLRSGFRKLAHDTEVQSFNKKYNFYQQPLHLHLQAPLPLQLALKSLSPFHSFAQRLNKPLGALLELSHHAR